MKYLKQFESYNKYIDTIEYLDDIEDLLRHKGKNAELSIKDGKLIYNNNNEVKVDEYGNVKLCRDNIHTIIGRILINDKSGSNINTYNNIYDDGTPIRIGDSVIVNGPGSYQQQNEDYLDFQGVVDGFSDDSIMVEDQEGSVFHIPPTSIERA